MESLSDTSWDVVISGTGLHQSFLALALSRSGKKILHVDKNEYYGGADAAFSLHEAEDWVNKVNQGAGVGPFESASIERPAESADAKHRLSFSRAYTLSLSPQLIYSRSTLLPSLVSSKVYRQLEFQAVGTWWVHRGADSVSSAEAWRPLQRVPSSREDVFADETLSMRSKRSLMKFLRHIQTEEQEETPSESELNAPVAEYLQSKLQIPTELYEPLMSLSLTPRAPNETTAGYALAKINRHLQSLGVYGPGFASMLLKWGGGAEISQVACRACAVGGAVYVLNRGVKQVQQPDKPPGEQEEGHLQVELSNGEWIRSTFIVGSDWDLPPEYANREAAAPYVKAARSVLVVSSPLEKLFPVTSEGGPVSAGTLVFFPGRAVSKGDAAEELPVYLLMHSSETGECPTGQCVIYGSTLRPSEPGYVAIETATNQLLEAVDSSAQILWSMRYTQTGPLDGVAHSSNDAALSGLTTSSCGRVLSFPAPSLDLSFDDGMIERVRRAWETIVGEDVAAAAAANDGEFLAFADREGAVDDEDE